MPLGACNQILRLQRVRKESVSLTNGQNDKIWARFNGTGLKNLREPEQRQTLKGFVIACNNKSNEIIREMKRFDAIWIDMILIYDC